MGSVFCIGAAILLFASAIALAKRRCDAGFRMHKTSWFWLAIFVIALLAVARKIAVGDFEGTTAQVAFFAFTLLVLGLTSQMREPWGFDRIRTEAPASQRTYLLVGLRDLAVIGFASLATLYGMEMFYNDWSLGFNRAGAIIEYIIILCVLSVLYFASGRRGEGPALGVFCFGFIGLAQYYVYLFKQAAIVPSDLFALGTAAAVSSNYDYIIDNGVLNGLLICGIAMCLLAFLVPIKTQRSHRFKHCLACVLSALICLGMVLAFTILPSYDEDPGIKIDSWFTFEGYESNGFISGFVSIAQDMVIEKPNNYSREDTQSLLKKYAAAYDSSSLAGDKRKEAEAQFEAEQPCVIAIMNESFSDLSIYDNLTSGYEGPYYLHKIQSESIASGPLAVSVNGGGTCNSEFEFLTANNMAFLGSSMYPYSVFDMEGVTNIAAEFNSLGYTTTAIHPNYATNWNRDVNYKNMGFDNFLSIDDFSEDVDRMHNEISDKATYEKVLELLESDDSPQFIFDVTMQNHGGYSRGDVPDALLQDYAVEGWSDEENAQLREYLGCIESSDEALKYLIDGLKNSDRKVVVVFFGDHQPGFAKELNDYLYPNEEDGAAHMHRVYQTTYFVWANYDVEGSERFSSVKDMTTSNLMALTMDAIGAPLTDMEKTQEVLYRDLPACNQMGFSDSEGTWYLFDSDESNFPEESVKALDVLRRASYLRLVDID